MIGGVDLDLGRPPCLLRSLAQRVLVGRGLGIVVARDRDQETRTGLFKQAVRAVWLVGNQPATMERGGRANPFGDRRCGADRPGPGHAIALGADPPALVDRLLPVEPGDQCCRIALDPVDADRLERRLESRLAFGGAPLADRFEQRRLGGTVIGIDRQDRKAIACQAPGHRLIGIAQPGDIGPHDHCRGLAAGGMNEEGIGGSVRSGDLDHAFAGGTGLGGLALAGSAGGQHPGRADRGEFPAAQPPCGKRCFFLDRGMFVAHRSSPCRSWQLALAGRLTGPGHGSNSPMRILGLDSLSEGGQHGLQCT